jgi:hypothetical protein
MVRAEARRREEGLIEARLRPRQRPLILAAAEMKVSLTRDGNSKRNTSAPSRLRAKNFFLLLRGFA